LNFIKAVLSFRAGFNPVKQPEKVAPKSIRKQDVLNAGAYNLGYIKYLTEKIKPEKI
jgi:hypothetical protein